MNESEGRPVATVTSLTMPIDPEPEQIVYVCDWDRFFQWRETWEPYP